MKLIIFIFLILSNLVFAIENNISNFKVAIDIGHTPKRWGATSAQGKKEYDFNKRLALELLDELHKQGITKAFIINPNDIEIKLLKRVSIANLSNADLFISLHHDSVQEKYLTYTKINGRRMHHCDKFNGYSIFYSKYNPQAKNSIIFAKILADELLLHQLTPTLHHAEKIKGENRELIDKKRGVYQFHDLIVLKKTTIPAILLESGIIVNRDEEKKLNDIHYRSKIVDSIVKSILKYISN